MTLPYVGNKGEKLVKKLKQDLKSKLPVTVKTQITYRATKLGSAFQIKDQTKLTHRHNITYLGTCPECKHRYVGQTRCRCQKRVIEHNFFIYFFYANHPLQGFRSHCSVRGYYSLLVATARAEATTRTGRQHTHAHTHTLNPQLNPCTSRDIARNYYCLRALWCKY